MTHSSYAAEHNVEDNERLEFLGDAVVDLAAADFITGHFHNLDQGGATFVRSRVVNEESLAANARELRLGELLRVNRGVKKEGGLDRNSILADAFEAVVAAVFLERGYEAARGFVWPFLAAASTRAASQEAKIDYKGRLTQLALRQGLGRPRYVIETDGPSHDKLWRATVEVGQHRASAQSTSKKSAELAAAQALVEVLDG